LFLRAPLTGDRQLFFSMAASRLARVVLVAVQFKFHGLTLVGFDLFSDWTRAYGFRICGQLYRSAFSDGVYLHIKYSLAV